MSRTDSVRPAGDLEIRSGRPAWALCAERPRLALESLAMKRDRRWPARVYAAPSAMPLRMIALAGLPRTMDTLLLRLLGRGNALKRANQDLLAARERSPMFDQVLGLMVQLFNQLRVGGPLPVDAPPEVLPMVDLTPYYEFKKQLVAEGVALGEARGEAHTLERQFARRLRRPLSAAELATLHARHTTLGAERLADVVLDLGPRTLARWLADPAAS